jgi:hypothetical protein
VRKWLAAWIVLGMVAGAWAEPSLYTFKVDSVKFSDSTLVLILGRAQIDSATFTGLTTLNGAVTVPPGRVATIAKAALDTLANSVLAQQALTVAGKFTAGDAVGDTLAIGGTKVTIGRTGLAANPITAAVELGTTDSSYSALSWKLTTGGGLFLYSNSYQNAAAQFVRARKGLAARFDVLGGAGALSPFVWRYARTDTPGVAFAYTVGASIDSLGRFIVGGTIGDSAVTVAGGLSTTQGAKIGGTLNVTGVTTLTGGVRVGATDIPPLSGLLRLGATTGTTDSITYGGNSLALIEWNSTGSLMRIGGTQQGDITLMTNSGAGNDFLFNTEAGGIANLTNKGQMLLGTQIASANAAGPSLLIAQGANDDGALVLSSTDVVHGMTTHAETNVYGKIGKSVNDAGGLYIMGLSDTLATLGSGTVYLQAISGDALVDSTDISTSSAVFTCDVRNVNGTGSNGLSDAENAFSWTNAGSTRMLLKGGGVLHLTNATPTALDEWDDRHLVRALERQRSAGVLMSKWDAAVKEGTPELIQAGVLSSDGSMFSVQGMFSLLGGASWQNTTDLYELQDWRDQTDPRITALERRTNELQMQLSWRELMDTVEGM